MPFGIVGLAVGYSYYKYYLKTKELGSYKTPLQSGVFPDGKAPNIGPAGSVWLFISVRTGISIQHFNFIFSRMLSRVAAPIARVPVRFARHVSWLFYLIILFLDFRVSPSLMLGSATLFQPSSLCFSTLNSLVGVHHTRSMPDGNTNLSSPKLLLQKATRKKKKMTNKYFAL